MEPQKLIAVAIRTFALYFGLTGLRDIATTVARYRNGIDLVSGSAIAILLLLFVLITILLWKFPFTIAKFIYPDSYGAEVKAWSQDEVYVAGFILLGVFQLSGVILESSRWAMYLFALYNTDEGLSQLDVSHKISMILVVVQFIVGITLIFGASGIKNLRNF